MLSHPQPISMPGTTDATLLLSKIFLSTTPRQAILVLDGCKSFHYQSLYYHLLCNTCDAVRDAALVISFVTYVVLAAL